ncbi:AtpZ/AtpI family protein [Candidatus Entotheonella palauensis]|nr:AtpZ/AtpI family protein [Candidatus Entotheonella palauensis]
MKGTEPDAERVQRVRKDAFPDTIEGKVRRKLKARGESHRSIWFGMGMFGVVGWSVAIPTLLGVVAGFWIDQRWPSRFSWTLMLLFIGVVLGCLNAWYWLQQDSAPERKKQG